MHICIKSLAAELRLLHRTEGKRTLSVISYFNVKLIYEPFDKCTLYS